MKDYFYLSFLILFSLLGTNSHGQPKVISVDTVSGTPSEALPFDQAFTLKVPTKATRVTALAFMPHVGRMTFKESLEYRDLNFHDNNPGQQPTINTYKIVELDSKNYRVKNLDGKNFILIDFKNPNLLDPGKQYTLFWVEESKPVVRLFDQYRAYKKGVAGAFTKAQTIYNELVQANIDNIGIDLGFPASFSATLAGPDSGTLTGPIAVTLAGPISATVAGPVSATFSTSTSATLVGPVSITKAGQGSSIVNGLISVTLTGPGSLTNGGTIESFYNDKIFDFPKKYKALEDKLDAYNQKIVSLTTNNRLNNNSSLRVLLQEFSQKSDNFDSNIKASYLKDIRQASQRIIKLISIDSTTYKNILAGLQNLDCSKCDLTDSDLYEDRAENIKASLLATDELYTVSESLIKGQPGLQGAVNSLKAFRDELSDLSIDFVEIVKARKAIKDNIFEIGLGPVFTLGGSTFLFSFETRNKLSIAPDFGFVTTRIGNDGSNPYGFVPYLGFHVNFRPINRDVPFWSYYHKPLHYTSLFIGWSLVSIDNGPKQAAGVDSVASFFSKGKGTFLTGLGFRLGNAVRLTVGEMWYFKYFQSTSNPAVYDRRKLQTWPFVGLSLDLALKDLLNGISDIFTGAPRAFRPPVQAAATN